jgi:hypothetical protein
MRDRFSNLAAVCCEETIAKSRSFVCLCLVLDVSAESRRSIFVLGGREMETRDIKKDGEAVRWN